MTDAPLTVGLLRRVIAELPDDAVIRPAWAHSMTPGDGDPGVVLHGFDACDGELRALVGLFDLSEVHGDEEDE